MPVIYVCTLAGYNFKMYSKSALCRQPTSVGPGHNEQFINVQMSILALRDTGPILLKILRKCRVCYHWKEILNENVNPPPAVNLNDTNVFILKSLKPRIV